MSDRSAIEWTDSTWNPVRGCTKVSPGCKHCYAETFAERFRGVPGHAFEQGFDLRLVPEKLSQPLHWARPRRIFVNSMSDLFHEDIPLDYIRRVFAIMVEAHWHSFQILTKRSKRLTAVCSELPWPPNVWMGVSIESAEYAWRALDLMKIPARVRFVSAEPLLGPIPDLPVEGLDWMIVGGESGRHARTMELDWARELRNKCRKHGVAFFLKQLGGRRQKRSGAEATLDGRRWMEWPHVQNQLVNLTL
jgi:protein gp37